MPEVSVSRQNAHSHAADRAPGFHRVELVDVHSQSYDDRYGSDKPQSIPP
jgi:hypothetical protein